MVSALAGGLWSVVGLGGVPEPAEAAVTGTWDANVSVSERYDNNVRSAVVGAEERDVMTSAGLETTVTLAGPGVAVHVRYGAGSNRYAHLGELNFSSHVLSMGGDFSLPLGALGRRVKTAIDASVSSTSTLASQPDATGLPADTDGILVGRSRARRGRVGAAADVAVTERVRASVGTAYATTRFDEVGFADRTTRELTTGLTYRWTSATDLGVGYGVTTFEYGDAGDQFRTDEATASVSHRWGPRLRGAGGWGWVWSDGRLTALSGNLEVVHEGPRARATLRYRRGVGTGGGASSSPTLSERVEALVGGRLSPRVSASASASYVSNRTLVESGFDVVGVTVSAGADVQVSRWLHAGLSATRLYQDGRSLSVLDRQRTIVSVALVAASPTRRF